MFSDSYTNVNVDTWRTSWSQANLEDIAIKGIILKNGNLNFVGIEAATTPINASSMTFFHTDIWSSDLTEFKVKLIDFELMVFFGVVMIKNMKSLYLILRKMGKLGFTWQFTGLTILILHKLFLLGAFWSTTVYVDNVFFTI
jgi:hypothetical protein